MNLARSEQYRQQSDCQQAVQNRRTESGHAARQRRVGPDKDSAHHDVVGEERAGEPRPAGVDGVSARTSRRCRGPASLLLPARATIGPAPSSGARSKNSTSADGARSKPRPTAASSTAPAVKMRPSRTDVVMCAPAGQTIMNPEPQPRRGKPATLPGIDCGQENEA